MSIRAVIDACVLASTTQREALFQAAELGALTPYWSDRIEGEWRSAAAKGADRPPEDVIAGEIALAHARFPDASVTNWRALEGPLSLPDWNDRHVLAAAIAAEAPLIVTENLRDFPARRLAEHGVRAQRTDEFLIAHLGAAEDVRALADGFIAASPFDRGTIAAQFKRARMPRYAKRLRDAFAEEIRDA